MNKNHDIYSNNEKVRTTMFIFFNHHQKSQVIRLLLRCIRKNKINLLVCRKA